jgi:hypothetical protein
MWFLFQRLAVGFTRMSIEYLKKKRWLSGVFFGILSLIFVAMSLRWR